MQGNTFQVVLSSDGQMSFVFFLYFDIRSGEAGIGFNAGDGVRSFSLNGSLTAATQEVEESGNVRIDGYYAYRVDLSEIVAPGGKDVKNLPTVNVTNLWIEAFAKHLSTM